MQGDLQRALSRNLRDFREAEGSSGQDFARRLGYHPTYWAAVERGERTLTLGAIERIAAELGIEPLLLLDGRKGATGPLWLGQL